MAGTNLESSKMRESHIRQNVDSVENYLRKKTTYVEVASLSRKQNPREGPVA